MTDVSTDVESDTVAAQAALLASQLDLILERTATITAVESGSYDAAGVDAVVGMIDGYLAELGFTGTRMSIGADLGQAYEATLQLADEGLRVLVLGHADTVWPSGSTSDWEIVTEGDRLSGPGLGDMKCALVMAVHAIGAALERGIAGIASITYALVPDEELGSVGSRGWLEDLGRRTDLCLTLEGCLEDGGLITSRGAVGAMVLTAHGRTSHSTEPDGRSALSALAPLVQRLEALTDRGRRVVCSVGILRSGTARQVVPDFAELHVDLRAPDMAAAESLVAEIRAAAGRLAGDGVRIGIEGGITRPAMPDAVSAPVYVIAASLAQAAGMPVRRVAEMGGSDASIVAQHARWTLDGLGPLARHQCSRQEYVETSTVIPRTALLSALLCRAGRALTLHQHP